MEGEQLLLTGLYRLELLPQLVQEQRLDQFQDVLFAGVMRAQVAARLLVHDRLEQRAEDGRRDSAPVQRAAIQQRLPHGGIEPGRRQRFGEQPAVHVRECGQLFIQVLEPFARLLVQHMEQRRQMMRQVGAVFVGLLLDVILELPALEDAGVFGEQAEQQTHQIVFQRVAFVAYGLHLVVQPAHALGGLDVDRVLFFDLVRLVTGDETERLYVLVQVRQREFELGVFLQVVQAEFREIRDQYVFREVALGNSGEIIQRLYVGLVQVLPARLVLDQQDPFPEQVDEALLLTQFLDRLLEGRHPLAGDPEDVEEVVPERFGIGVFGGFAVPFLGKGKGTAFDFVPAERHRLP